MKLFDCCITQAERPEILSGCSELRCKKLQKFSHVDFLRDDDIQVIDRCFAAELFKTLPKTLSRKHVFFDDIILTYSAKQQKDCSYAAIS